MKISCVADAKAQVGEGPVWDPEDEVLWWTDINGRRLHRHHPASGGNDVYEMPFKVGCFALRRHGGFVLAAEHGFWFWRPDGGEPECLLEVETDRPENRMNDGCCDRQGRLIASSMHLGSPRQPLGACWRLDHDLKAAKLADGLAIGNGIAFSPAGNRFYLADTPAAKVWAHDYDPALGQPGATEVFADLADLPGLPEGATVDAEGGYWLAAVTGNRLYRFLPNGYLERTIELPVSKPTRPMFGGPRLDRLFVTSIGSNAPPSEPLAGGLFVIDGLGYQGLPEPRFAG